jgi:hypothetical protein
MPVTARRPRANAKTAAPVDGKRPAQVSATAPGGMGDRTTAKPQVPNQPGPSFKLPRNSQGGGRRGAKAPARRLATTRDLIPDATNANKGTHRGRALVETSVRKYGFGRSVLADKHGRIIAGNKTVEAATALGDRALRVVQTDGKELVVVQRTDLDLATDVDAKELAVADNRASELGLAWDTTALERLVADGAQPQQFWRTQEWETLLRDGGREEPGDEIPEMALQAFEEYNYLVVVFRNSQDWQGACDLLEIRREAVTLGTVRKVGLGRVLDGANVLALLKTCTVASSSPRGNGPTRSRKKR